jgi:surface protein
MSLYIGNDKIGSLYLGSTKIKEAWVGDVKVYGPSDPYNPLNLPPFTVRCKFVQGYTPYSDLYRSTTLVSADENIWDITRIVYNLWDFRNLFLRTDELIEVLGANTTGVTLMDGMFNDCHNLSVVNLFDTRSCTTMEYMFCDCTSLTSVPLFDTSSVTNMYGTFHFCTSLASLPLFDTHLVEDMTGMLGLCESLRYIPLFNTESVRNVQDAFQYCENVESGALALYQQMSNQDVPPVIFGAAFHKCGNNTTTGLAELQQIPESWGGLAPG